MRIALRAAGRNAFLMIPGLIAAHNMVWPPPDSGYLKAVTADPGLETVFVNMQAAGIGVTLKKR